jgi:hypothetical protein
MRDAAEALDLMNFQHDLQHLDVKPRNLFLVGNRLKVADFGLVQCLEGLAATAPNSGLRGEFTPHYAAPEVFEGVISRHSDQYSIAITYQELLTGSRPFNGNNPRQLALQHLNEQPDLGALPATDRAVVAKALAKDPQERHLSCLAFVRALLAGSNGGVAISLPPRSIDPSTDTPVPPALRMTETMEDLFLGPADTNINNGTEVEQQSPRVNELMAENAELRRLLAHSRTGLKRANEKADADIRDWQRRYENVMRNKFEALRQQIKTGEAPKAGAPASSTPVTREEMLALHQELERQRTILRREEKELHAQVRAEEIQLCKERAELSRQRAEWLRAHPNAQNIPGVSQAEFQSLKREVEKEREQLHEEELGFKAQVEQLEKQIAGERAELARQQAEWASKQKELKAQLEMMHACEASLNKKLAPLAELKGHIDEIFEWRKTWGGKAP